MSYHVKSAPFFGRAATTGKKNGELQRLKEEHDRLKEFNGHAIDVKMCHVRLKRLFKEIEEIKETNLKRRHTIKEEAPKNQMPFYRDDSSKSEKNRRRSHQNGHQYRKAPEQTKTMAQIRNEGGLSRVHRPKIIWSPSKAKADQDERTGMARVIRRLNYGNQVSSWNMHRMLINNLNGEVRAGIRETRRFLRKPFPRTDPVKTPGVINRNKNENNVSSNITIPKMSRRHKKYAAAMDDARIASNPYLIDGNMSQGFNFEYNLGEYPPTNFKHRELLYSCRSSDPQSEDDEKGTIARKRWGKIAEVISGRFDIKKSIKNLKTLEKCDNDLEYQLRTISNGTHLPQSQIMVQQDDELNISENVDDNLDNSEVLLNKEILLDVISRSGNPLYVGSNFLAARNNQLASIDEPAPLAKTIAYNESQPFASRSIISKTSRNSSSFELERHF
uniref:Uncharacterized protein n=1 Tax=Glossina austeni TaxID=7395 RepID=A0A1A9VA73_GLOAU